MIRHLNRLYWIGYISVMFCLYWVLHNWFGVQADNAALAAMGLVAGLLFAAHVGFNISGFALSYSIRKIPQIRDKGLPFHSTEGESFHRLSIVRWLKAVLVESISSLKLITLLQPWAPNPDGIRLSGKAWRKKKPLPVLLVHGYLCNSAVWAGTRALLERADVSTHAIT
ncbi:MAG: hypothetical protein ACK5Q1_20575, partial [Limnobacter sp.]